MRLSGLDGQVRPPRKAYSRAGSPSGEPPRVSFAADGGATVDWDAPSVTCSPRSRTDCHPARGGVVAAQLRPNGELRSVQRVGTGCSLGSLDENGVGSAALTMTCPTGSHSNKGTRSCAWLNDVRDAGFRLARAPPRATSENAFDSSINVSPAGQVSVLWSQFPPERLRADKRPGDLRHWHARQLRVCRRQR